MSTKLKVLGVSGSMREKSNSRLALGMSLAVCREMGAETRVFDLRDADLPVFRPDRSGEPPQSIKDAIEAVRWADAFILASPDYHGSMSGAVKNFLDYHWKELTGKLFGYIVASHEKGLTVFDQMRTAVRQCYGWSLPYGATVSGSGDFAADGTLTNQELSKRLRMLGRDVVVYGSLLVNQYRSDLVTSAPDTFARK